MTLNTTDKCDCSTKFNVANFDPVAEVDKLIKAIEGKTDVKKIAEAADKCLRWMSLVDACEFMVKHQYPITPVNILKFKNIADQAYFIRLDIMKQLILN